MTMQRFRAPFLFDGTRVRQDVAVVLDGEGRVVFVGDDSETFESAREIVLPPGALVLPGLVNAHTHVELAAQAGTLPRALQTTREAADESAFLRWAGALVAARPSFDADARAAGRTAAAEALARFGTVLVGDVTNEASTVPCLQAAGIEGCIFHEVFGWNATRLDASLAAIAAEMLERKAEYAAAGFRYAPVPHTPYTTAPEAIARLRALAGASIGSIHFLEHAAERRALEDGEGAAAAWLGSLGLTNLPWPRQPAVAYAAALGLLDGKTLLVHLTVARGDELCRIAAAGNPVVLCPRSNLFILGFLPDLPAILAAGVPLALGTDSWASNDDLDVLGEVAALAAAYPAVPLETLYTAATWGGARALGFADRSHFAVGARPRPFAVPLPPTTDPLRTLLAHRNLPRSPLGSS